MGLSTVRKGINHVLRGELGPVISYLRSRPKVYKRNIVHEYRQVPEVIEDGAETNWIDSDGTVVVQYPDDPRRYRSIVQDTEFRIDPDEPFDQLELECVGAKNYGGVTVTLSLRTESGTQTTERTLDCGDVSRIPLIERFDDSIESASIRISGFQNLLGPTRVAKRILGWDDTLRATKPTVRTSTRHPPIFVFSLDSVRFADREPLSPLMDALGDDAVVPAEPRTQGHWTPPSHASLFTGTHPGDHKYVGWDDHNSYVISSRVETLGELLANNYYKSSAIVSWTRILPEYGFGRGFDRFKLNKMSRPDWIHRDTDARETASDLVSWIDADLSAGHTKLFYFAHFMDPHAPYISPPHLRAPGLDFADVVDFRTGHKDGYLENFRREPREEDDLYESVLNEYRSSIQYTGDQIVRIIDFLKDASIFEDAFVIVLGDHGEEFGERGFYGHNSLYDANIRPFMAIKPPARTAMTVRDDVDFIDVLPTIAKLVDADQPTHCRGVPLQEGAVERPRITERIRPDSYNISVEIDDWKGIFTYEDDYPSRPTADVLADTPTLEEIYSVSAVRNGDFDSKADEIDPDSYRRLREVAVEFASSETIETEATTDLTPTEETRDLLEDMGYV